MSCYHPNKVKVRGEVIPVPCGKCIGCKFNQSKSWALRCVHEASLHDENCFVTLTYNDKELPENGTLVKKHLQDFFKRLRSKILPKTFRYYSCGEYGKSGTIRPHYHVIMFGYIPDDLVFLRYSDPKKSNRFSKAEPNKLFDSETISKCWGKGFITVGEVNFESAGYVARYTRKKINGEQAIKHYGNRIKEFALMSRRPGIGFDWIKDNMTDVYPKDFTTWKGKRIKPPRYYDNFLMRENWSLYEYLKQKRKDKVEELFELDEEEFGLYRRRQKEKFKYAQTKNLKRSLEDD